jgi:hypothetical protein
MYFKSNIQPKMNFKKVLHRTKSLGNGKIDIFEMKSGDYICKLERSKRATWNILDSKSGYINYGYETKIEAVASAYYGKDCRINQC